MGNGVLRTQWQIFRSWCTDTALSVLRKRGFEALAPRTQTFERISRRRLVETDRPVFPGYLFAEVRDWGRMHDVPCMDPRPLCLNGEPYRMLSRDVELVQRMQDRPPADPGAPVPVQGLKKGSTVRILQGPFATFKATVDEDKGDRVRLLAS